jgi:hypothetical protein
METAMKTKHMFFRFVAVRLLPLLVCAVAAAGAWAQTSSDPPARVGTLSAIEGTVALAPRGEAEWADAQRNRPVTGGDRLWTDAGSRAELHLGSAVLHMDGQTFLDVTALDVNAFQASLNEGTVEARVRELASSENFEIDTPQLAFRASQAGDYRIGVDPATGITSVVLHSGAALVYGASGNALQLRAGEQIAFTGNDLEQVAMPALRDDGFDRWAADRNRQEDQSIAARYVPREVVGYHELDPYGTWEQDPTYGAVWLPQITVADWAPYRYGHWDWIAPWGWTWIDDAPWGFAPFHYGRWAMIHSRWCWVPGRIGPRPFYAPALVAFVGGNNFNLSIGSSRGIAWFPLAPGEAWHPTFRASPVYVRNVNRNIVVNNTTHNYFFQQHPTAVTSVRVEDFSRGRPVHQHWQPVNPAQIAHAPVATAPALPRFEGRRFAEAVRPAHTRVPPPAVAAVAPKRPQGAFVPPGLTRTPPGLARTPPGLAARPGERGRPFTGPEASVPPEQRPPRVPQDQRRAAQQQASQAAQEWAMRQQQAAQAQSAQQERIARQQQRAAGAAAQQRPQAQAASHGGEPRGERRQEARSERHSQGD